MSPCHWYEPRHRNHSHPGNPKSHRNPKVTLNHIDGNRRMPYKRRRRSYHTRRRSRYTRKRWSTRGYSRRRRNRYRKSYTRSRRSYRSMRRGGRRRYAYQRGTIATQEKIPRVKFSNTKRRVRAGRRLGNKIDEHMGHQSFFKANELLLFINTAGTPAGTYIFDFMSPQVFRQIWNHLLEQQSRLWAQGGYTSSYLGSHWIAPSHKQQICFHKITYSYKITNATTGPVRIRCSEWKAKRDIPMQLGWGGNLNWSALVLPQHPIVSLYYNNVSYAAASSIDQRQAESQTNNNNGTSVFSNPTSVWTYFRNGWTTWPSINYYFKIKKMKEIRMQPGGTIMFKVTYTPKIKLHSQLWLHTSPYRQWDGVSPNLNPYGVMFWKGLNDRGPLIEFVGEDGVIRLAGVDNAGVTQAEVTIRNHVSLQCSLMPLKMDTHYETGATNYSDVVSEEIKIALPDLPVREIPTGPTDG